MEQLNNLDVVFLIIVGISALVGIARGMTKEILSILGWVLAAAATFYLTPLVNPIAKEHFSSELMASVVSAMAILLVFCIVWILVVDKIASAVRQSKLSAFDRLFGFVFGAARGALIIILVALMISALVPDASKEGAFAESKIFKEASLYVDPLKNMIPQEWIDAVKSKTESLGFGKVGSEDKKDVTKDQPSEANKSEDSKAENIDTKETNTKEEEKGALKDNLDVLQKTGEELFDKLAQPKPAGEEATENGPEESDLDKLLDVLEDKLVSSDAKDSLAEASNKAANAVVDTITEGVADKVNAKQPAIDSKAK